VAIGVNLNEILPSHEELARLWGYQEWVPKGGIGSRRAHEHSSGKCKKSDQARPAKSKRGGETCIEEGTSPKRDTF